MTQKTENDPERDPARGQAHVPKPPDRESVEEIDRAQELITDDWTGEGGKPAPGD
jgi:hypothetical protein